MKTIFIYITAGMTIFDAPFKSETYQLTPTQVLLAEPCEEPTNKLKRKEVHIGDTVCVNTQSKIGLKNWMVAKELLQ